MKRLIAIFGAMFISAGFADDAVRPSRGAAAVPVNESEAQAEARSAVVTRVAAVGAAQPQAAVRPTRGGVNQAQAVPASPVRAQDSRGASGSAVITRAAAVGSVQPQRAARIETNAESVPSRESTAVRATRAGASSASRSEDQTQPAQRVSAGTSGSGTARSATTRTSNSGLRPSTAEVGGRAVIGRSNVMTGSNIDDEINKKQTRRARAATDSPLAENPFEAKPTAEAPSASDDLASCSASYFDCLNQFCNVLDANQKQCSCSGNLTQYKKVEDSLQKANDELNNVAQQIRYVGLSADEVRSILKETEAEAVLSSVDDNTQSRKLLEEIEKIIASPTGVAASSSSSSLGFELDFSGESSSFDLGSMFGNNDSFANMRGTDLYNAAKKKCSPVLTRCATKKADQSVISSQYDIEIDKACIQYEAGLTKATNGVKTNIRSATQMLQKARLAVMEDQNAYDARGCVAALDACMRDDIVCGSNYYKCLDPTKTAIDENGKVIPGGDVTTILELAKEYSATSLDTLIANSTCSGTAKGTGTQTDGCMVVKYLKDKIGATDNNGRVQSGFCRPVMDKCRLITYDSGGKYNEKNTIVKSYLERAMTQVKAAQNSIIADHASTCIHDVSTCYNSQLTQVNSYSGGMALSPSTVKPILMGACRNVALSCAYAVFQDHAAGGKCPRTADNTETCINSLSEMFYQAMLCPANSTWYSTGGTAGNGQWVNSNCSCASGYKPCSGNCVLGTTCPTAS